MLFGWYYLIDLYMFGWYYLIEQADGLDLSLRITRFHLYMDRTCDVRSAHGNGHSLIWPSVVSQSLSRDLFNVTKATDRRGQILGLPNKFGHLEMMLRSIVYRLLTTTLYPGY